MLSSGDDDMSTTIQQAIADIKLEAPIDTIALVLGALTAGGGIAGYARTGSVPSVAAGVTVGSLVRLRTLFQPIRYLASHDYILDSTV